ncbi:hypothetical protein L1049_003375 [Liquidambar formosana]|uniref:Uncharacterized protein n=1 Tax=Liquidambar formosana TaxID=63359 RepID=A0AAP0NMB9_LIQFO
MREDKILRTHLWFSSMEAIMQLGAGLNIGCLSFLEVGLIAMQSACWVRVKVTRPEVQLLVLSRYLSSLTEDSSFDKINLWIIVSFFSFHSLFYTFCGSHIGYHAPLIPC